MTRLMILAAMIATPALAADPVPTRSPAEIVCALTGDCTPSSAKGATRPAEAAFSFTRPGAAKPAAPALKGAYTTRAPNRAPMQSARRAAVPAAAASGLDMRITFASGSAEMTPQGRVEAAQFAKALTMPQLAGRRFVVEGHTDAVGGRDYNLALSQRRAAAVADYLRGQGVSAERLEAKGYGFDKPLAGRGAAANRRVQFVPAA